MPAKRPRVVAYISPELKADLEKLAKLERRSESQMIAVLLEDAVKQAKEKGQI
ncbi:MAG: hypothetical protein AAGA83_27295 [Cyanobacteria bacterium P01_F01_bin.116]